MELGARGAMKKLIVIVTLLVLAGCGNSLTEEPEQLVKRCQSGGNDSTIEITITPVSVLNSVKVGCTFKHGTYR
jgi:hypothetical protein